jgi:hypothetical protein
VRDTEVKLAVVARATEHEARWRHKKMYNRVMMLYCVLASEEKRAAMAEPIGWRPVMDTDVTMEEHMCILQARVNERFPQQ